MTTTYSISRDGLADLALPLDLEQRLADVLAGEDGTTVSAEIEQEINARIAEHGADDKTGEWYGEWSAEQIVRDVLAHRDDIDQLAALRRVAKMELDAATDRLRGAVVRALVGGATEAETARRAGVDRMTVRSWSGK